MPMDGFTLSFMVKELNEKLIGGRVDKVNQPSRDTLVLLIRTHSNYRLLLNMNASQARIQLTQQSFENPIEPPVFCMLMRKHLQGARLKSIQQIRGDRIVQLTFDSLNEMGDAVQKRLMLEIMGRYSDLTLVDEEGTIIDAMRHVNSEMSRVRTLLPGGTYQLPPQPPKLVMEELTAVQLEERLRDCGLPLFKALCENVAGMASLCSKEICLQCGLEPTEPVCAENAPLFAAKLEKCFHSFKPSPVVLYDPAGNTADFFPFPYLSFDTALQKPSPTLSDAMDAYYSGRDLRLRMQQRSAGLQKQIRSVLERNEKKRSLMLDTLSRRDETERNRVFGELLTANLYGVPKGASSVRLQNYYENPPTEIEIPLSPLKTPVQNAQQYYKKYRKEKTAQEYAAQQLDTLERDIALLEGTLEDLEKCETSADLAEIRSLLTEGGFIKREAAKNGKNKKLPEGKPYRFTSPEGILIEVGKNALQNDRLTLHAKGEETWLHAQGIPGSHVIIHSPVVPPDGTLLYAAKLAAFFSRGRNTPKQPVDYTLRKFVKKAPGAPAGLVIYHHFQTIDIDLSTRDVAEITNAMHGL